MTPDVPQWHVAGDWVDVRRCTIPCLCTFAQARSEGDCDGVMAWHIREGHYGDVRLDGLDERADEGQREALQTIFGDEAAEFASAVGEIRGIEYVPITFEIADDLAYRAAEVPGKVTAEALTGPTTPPGRRFRFSTLPVPRSGRARLRSGAERPPTPPTASASSGNGTAARASASSSTGRARRGRRAQIGPACA